MDFGRQDIFPPIPSVSIIVLLNPDIITGHISLICLYWTILWLCLVREIWKFGYCSIFVFI